MLTLLTERKTMKLREYLINYNPAVVSETTGSISLGNAKTTTVRAESREWAIRELMSQEHIYCIVTLREIKVIIPFRKRVLTWLGKEIN